MSRSTATKTAIGLALAVVLFGSANVLAEKLLPNARFDLTDRQLYTLSPSTRAVLAKIREPITLDFYFSKSLGDELPSYAVYAEEVRELLQQYAALAPGKIRLRILDPQPYSDTEDQATAAGIQGVPLDQDGPNVYFGLVGTNATDDKQTVPFFQADRQRFLEYDLTKLIRSLAFPNRKTIGLVSALPVNGDPMAQMQGRQSPPLVILQQLEQSFDVKDLSTDFDKVPDGTDLLMIVQPSGLSPKTQYAIDQYVMKGGHVLLFADPNPEFATAHPSQMTPPGPPPAPDLDALMRAWGIQLVKGKVVGDKQNAVAVSLSQGQGDTGPATDYLAWMNLQSDAFNHDDPVTAQLSQVTMATAGALRPVPDAGTDFEPLIRSSDQSELIDTAKTIGTPDLTGLLEGFQPTGERYVLAARVTGTARTAFPDGPPADDKAMQGVAEIKTSAQPLNVIVVSDMDLLDDRFWVQQQNFFGQNTQTATANNGDFIANAVDNLAGSADLVGLRARGSAARPFTRVDRIQHQAQDRYQAEQKALQDKLKGAESTLAQLASKDNGDQAQLTPAEQQSVDQMRTTIIQTRQQLRHVQLALRQDIDALKLRLVLLDVGLIPLCVAVAALVLSALRARRRKRAGRAA
jgi:ABC-type uncharacterized transport system involved in gliding motility auxiliary subunit